MTTTGPTLKGAALAVIATIRFNEALNKDFLKHLNESLKTKSLTKNVLEEAAAKAQKKTAAELFKDANIDECEKLLKAIGDAILKQVAGCSVIYGPTKTQIRAKEKVDKDYGGDWWQLKDMVRMTVVAPDEETMKKVAKAIRTQVCVASQGRGLAKAEPPDDNLKESDCGYTGYNFVATLENWRFGEIQLNVPGVMYGQMGKGTFEGVVGNGQAAKYNEMYGIDGGQGHIYYELYRRDKTTPVAKDAQQISQKYFRLLRQKPTAEVKKAGLELQKEMKAFNEKYSKEIAKLH